MVARLSEALGKAKADPSFRALLEALGNSPMDDAASAAISAFLVAEVTRWGEVLRTSGIRPDG